MTRFGVIGAGQMGRGIAQVAAQAGFTVKLSDADRALAERGKANVAQMLDRLVEKGRMPKNERDAVVERITVVDGIAGLNDVDIAVEAATEREDLKKKI